MRPRRDQLITSAYDTLARSPRIVRAAVRLRNVAVALIGHRITERGIDPELNGKAWLAHALSPTCHTFIDVGAWSSLMLAAAPHARGVAFEPSSSALSALRERLGSNPHLEIVDAAVSDAAGEVMFNEEPGAGETSRVAAHSQQEATPRPVPVVTIDNELERLGIERVDLLKIDAEGYDLHVLRGAQEALASRRIGAVQFEYNAPGHWLARLSPLPLTLCVALEWMYSSCVPTGSTSLNTRSSASYSRTRTSSRSAAKPASASPIRCAAASSSDRVTEMGTDTLSIR
jgi:FkbM family methyltransferase